MSLETRKITLTQLLLQVRKESVLDKLQKILEEETIVAYTTSGEPLTAKTYNKALKQAEKDIEKGRTYTTEELKKEIKSWKK